MSLPDSAEYWNDVKGMGRLIFTKDKQPPHDCKPRGGKKGTYNRYMCPVCGKRFSKRVVNEAYMPNEE